MCPLLMGAIFSFLFLKCLESSEMARQLISKCFPKKSPPPDMWAKYSRGVDGGLSGGSSVRRPRSVDPYLITMGIELKTFLVSYFADDFNIINGAT